MLFNQFHLFALTVVKPPVRFYSVDTLLSYSHRGMFFLLIYKSFNSVLLVDHHFPTFKCSTEFQFSDMLSQIEYFNLLFLQKSVFLVEHFGS